ncbi:MAG: hypothetical protein ACRCZF_06550, partial [Gemmataceae bacterium]
MRTQTGRGLVILASIVVLSVAVATPVPRETEAQRVTRLWGTFIDPDKGSSITLIDKIKLKMSSGPGPRGINPANGLNNAPRTLRELTGNFTATVRIVNDVAPPGVKTGGPGFVLSGGGGMLLWVSDAMHLRLSRSQWPGENGVGAKTTYNLRGVVNGDEIDIPNKTIDGVESKPVT